MALDLMGLSKIFQARCLPARACRDFEIPRDGNILRIISTKRGCRYKMPRPHLRRSPVTEERQPFCRFRRRRSRRAAGRKYRARCHASAARRRRSVARAPPRDSAPRRDSTIDFSPTRCAAIAGAPHSGRFCFRRIWRSLGYFITGRPPFDGRHAAEKCRAAPTL